MATSRTGTTRYKHNSAKALRQAQRNGLTNCPCQAHCRHHKGRRCNVPLDYVNRRRPNGATTDHITAWNNGGTDDTNNLTVICFTCNTSQGDKRPKKREHVTTIDFTT